MDEVEYLYDFADLDVGLAKAVEDKAIESLIEHPFQAPDDPLAGLEGLLPPNLTIQAGWELPTNIPLPPPGWKLGDPITLPPMDAITAPGRTAEQQLRHVAQTGSTKADGPIQGFQFPQFEKSFRAVSNRREYSPDGHGHLIEATLWIQTCVSI
ncbi:hypothetical protein QQ045_015957 [Rhodiola kirilowii]